jgi:hypothetical protein
MTIVPFLVAVLTTWPAVAQTPQGMYFAKKEYVPHPLPTFADSRDKLLKPIYHEDPLYVQRYWKTWELGFRNFYEPKPGSGFVSQFIDAAFNENIFLWDTCFLTMFCNYGHPLVPGIGSLDNFYAKQYEDGEICREINRTTGKDFTQWVNADGQDLFSRWGRFSVKYVGRDVPQPPPHLTLDALNHPIFAWAELESFRVTGDRARLALVYEPLVRYYGALQKYLRQGNGLYMTDWASMDNSPRVPDLAGGGTAVDTSSQMVLFARQLAEIADHLGKTYCSESRLARQVLKSVVSLGRPCGGGLAVMDASFEEVVNEVLLAKKTAGKFAQETGAALATPSVKTAGFTAGLGQLGRERLQTAAEHQLQIGFVFQIQDQQVFFGQRLEVPCQLPPTMRATTTSLQVTPVAF